MKKIIATGKTVEEAVSSALRELNATEDKVKVNILEKPTKRLFGLMGSKEAVVEVELLQSTGHIDVAKTFLTDIFQTMNVPVEIEQMDQDNYNILLNLVGADLGILIGRRGQTLDALQYLVNIVVNKNNKDEKMRIILDAENYRKRRKATLEDLADKLANKVLRTGKDVVLEPMTPLERKIIHTQLQNHGRVQTYSLGEEPNRKVVITKK